MVVPLLAVITPAGSQFVAAGSWWVAADLRTMEEMSASTPAATEEPAGGFDLDICELEGAGMVVLKGKIPQSG